MINSTAKPCAAANLNYAALDQLFQQQAELSPDQCGQLAELLGGSSQTTRGPVSLTLGNTRDFGLVLRAGLDPEEAYRYRTDQAWVAAAIGLTDADTLLRRFQHSQAWQELTRGLDDAGRSRVAASLYDSLTTLLALGERYAPGKPDTSCVIDRLTLIPAVQPDGRLTLACSECQTAPAITAPAPRPRRQIERLLHPRSIGIIGVSASKMNFGRIILKNLLASGYEPTRMTIIRPGETEIDGVRCVESLAALDAPLDLFVVAVAADAVYDLVDEVIATQAAESVLLIPGGLGETETSREPAAALAERINRAHARPDGGPVFLGANCLGVVSHPGGYDSWFIPQERLPKVRKKAQRNSALISQSGAFMITRLSRNPWLDPAYMMALGNQTDLTHGDMLGYLTEKPEITTIGVYIEGFRDLDGRAFAQAVREATLAGKQVVVYKAGKTGAGAAAARGHTASLAGDYTLCRTLLEQAGALVADSIDEFDDLFYIADRLQDKRITGNRLGGVSGAGFETVGMADSINTGSASLRLAALTPETVKRLEAILVAKRLDALMEVRNPIDINPGADDEAHVQCVAAFAADPGVDAVVVGLDPASPAMRALAESARPGFDIHSEQSVVQLLPELVRKTDKPVIGVVDGGPLYDAMAAALMDQGVCVFRCCDRAVRALARYTQARLATLR